MPDLLVEILSEEMPATVQAEAANGIFIELLSRLEKLGLYRMDHVDQYYDWTPRRLAFVFPDLADASAAQTEERKGPREDAPEIAIQGFLRSAGLTSLNQAELRETGKGRIWFAVTQKPGQPLIKLLPQLIVDAMLAYRWPKAMRWRETKLAWIRPIRGLVGLFGNEVLPGGLHFGCYPDREAGYALIPDFDGDENFIAFSGETVGHRFMMPSPVSLIGKPTDINTLKFYREALCEAKVMVDADERRNIIYQKIIGGGLQYIRSYEFPKANEASPLSLLMTEVANLVEWPVPLEGQIDPEFMDLPPELLISVMEKHQRYFATRNSETGKLEPRFIVIANIEPEIGDHTIIKGNERVLRARLSDAAFYWQRDRAAPLDSFVELLSDRVFHVKLGTMLERAKRIEVLAGQLAETLGYDRMVAQRAGWLAKADLSSGVVAEFPDLQGIMGSYYAAAQSEAPEVAEAIRDHYKPTGPNDPVPTSPISIAVALADKIDTLVNFFAIDEVPTGSRDPFGLRRAALGIIRTIIENNLRLDLAAVFVTAPLYSSEQPNAALITQIIEFIRDRLSVFWRSETVGEGYNSNHIRTVLNLSNDIVSLKERLDALKHFLETKDAENLLTAHRRAINILRIEEAKTGVEFPAAPNFAAAVEPAERALVQALNDAAAKLEAAASREDFSAMMTELAALRAPLDAFFESVKVNSDDPRLRENRLRILAQIRVIFGQVADFSKI